MDFLWLFMCDKTEMNKWKYKHKKAIKITKKKLGHIDEGEKKFGDRQTKREGEGEERTWKIIRGNEWVSKRART